MLKTVERTSALRYQTNSSRVKLELNSTLETAASITRDKYLKHSKGPEEE